VSALAVIVSVAFVVLYRKKKRKKAREEVPADIDLYKYFRAL